MFPSSSQYEAKVVIATEDPDEEIRRRHNHIYWDDIKQKNVTTSYFDIPLPEPVVVFIHPNDDKTREYKTLNELSSQLGWDNGEEMVAKLDNYIKESEIYTTYQILNVAHPNIQLKKEWGDKYFMLRYVVKQKLLVRTNFNIEEELKYLEENSDELNERANDLITQLLLAEIGVKTVDELIYLLKRYKASHDRKTKSRGRKGKKGKRNNNRDGYFNGDLMENEFELCQEIRKLIYDYKGITKNEVLSKIKNNSAWWFVYASKYTNYNKLLTDLFKNKPLAKPSRNYSFKFWLPSKLYDYIMWLDQWVMNWTTGKKDKCEHRPKGLILIGDSRTGKTSLMSLIGDFSYFKNIWNSDNWEYLPAYTIMDDMDAQDEGKGLAFSWYKPWFGAQDAITITDKYRPKEDIINGKPLIWLNNFDIDETFKSESAKKYIEKNMVYINIGKRSLFEKPEPFEWIEGHTNYIEFDPKTTWYYRNVILPQERENEPGDIPPPSPPNDYNNHDDFNEPGCNKENIPPNHVSKKDLIFINETDDVIETIQDLEPLADRQKRILMQSEQGRPNKRIRNKN